MSEEYSTVNLSGKAFLGLCAAISAAVLAVGIPANLIAGVIGAEVGITILFLFVFGSIRYRLDKNALTYGMAMIIIASFWSFWWPNSHLNQTRDFGGFIGHYFLSLHGLDQLFHADTMLFILGLTLFVCVIAQTRILETVSFKVLRGTSGNVLTTIAILTGIVSFASGILDGVSMIGLLIRTMVIILFLAKIKDDAVIYSVIVSTIITTVCGMWLAYGEPPNLIMKANLHPHLDNMFFLRYCLPVAIGSYFIVYFNFRKRLKGHKVEIYNLDVLDLHTDDVRFLQAQRHGEVLTPIEFAESHSDQIGEKTEAVVKRLHQGEPLGAALVHEGVSENARRSLMGKYVTEELAVPLDQHYTHIYVNKGIGSDTTLKEVRSALQAVSAPRLNSQKIGALSFIPFIGFLIWHALDHNVPLFLASFAGFGVAFLGIAKHAKMRGLALHEAKVEYMEYIFLFPLFLSITLLQKTGFFETIAGLVHTGIDRMGAAHMAYIQFTGAAFLSAILDNNVVADFASRALHNLDIAVLHLFSMAQIAGYAVGGCWTHIGSAQSVVAYAFIQKEVDEHYTPFQWMKAMTPIILQIFLLMTLVVYGEAALTSWLH